MLWFFFSLACNTHSPNSQWCYANFFSFYSDLVRPHIWTVSYDNFFLWIWYVCKWAFAIVFQLTYVSLFFLCISGINAPTSQSFLNYVLLAVVYGITMILRKEALKVALSASSFCMLFCHGIIWLLVRLNSNKCIYQRNCLSRKLSVFMIFVFLLHVSTMSCIHIYIYLSLCQSYLWVLAFNVQSLGLCLAGLNCQFEMLLR